MVLVCECSLFGTQWLQEFHGNVFQEDVMFCHEEFVVFCGFLLNVVYEYSSGYGL